MALKKPSQFGAVQFVLAALAATAVIAVTWLSWLYFAPPIDHAQKFLTSAIAGDAQTIAKTTDWLALRQNFKANAKKQIGSNSNSQPDSVTQAIAQSILNSLIDQVLDTNQDWIANEVTLTHYIQGVSNYIAKGQSLKATGQMLGDNTYELSVTGGRVGATMWLYFVRVNMFDWAFVDMKYAE